jgi:protein-S-isoprenylcysteine O-methyltransferase Ste14
VLKIAAAAAIGALVGASGARARLLPHIDRSAFSSWMVASIVLWVAFSVYWSLAAKDRAPTLNGESIASRQLHVLAINLALLILIVPVPGLTRRLLPDSTALHAIGLAVQIASMLLAVWARRHLGANWSGEVRIASGHQLVRSGPYRFVRHPIYTALVGMYVGTGLISGQTHAALALVMVLLAYIRKIRLEEKALG